jgi:hypothetical protein
MLAPLAQLQQLKLEYAEGLTARVVVPLQHMLPQLQSVHLQSCGRILPALTCGQRRYGRELSAQERKQLNKQRAQREQQLLAEVRQLLRPGLELKVQGSWGDWL